MSMDYCNKPYNIFNSQISDKIIGMPNIVSKLISNNKIN